MKPMGVIIGAVMKATRGQADAARVRADLDAELLGEQVFEDDLLGTGEPVAKSIMVSPRCARSAEAMSW